VVVVVVVVVIVIIIIIIIIVVVVIIIIIVVVVVVVVVVFQLRTAAFKTYCVIWIRSSNFRHQASPHVSPRESTQWQKVELWARNAR